MNLRGNLAVLVWKYLPVVLLITISLLTLRSIDTQTSIAFNFSQQLIGVVVGVVVATAAATAGRDFWKRSSYALFVAAAILLMMTLVIGDTVQGSQRWLQAGPIRFQTSELMKIGLILAQARLLSRLGDKINSLKGFAYSALLTVSAMILVAIQPDLGTAITLAVIWVGMLMISKFSKMFVAVGIGALIIITPLITSSLQPYQQERLTSFLDPAADESDQGYNVRQAHIAISSGGVFGQGLDGGTQSQLEFIPSQHTDFIFSVVVEKLGFAGGAIVVLSLLAITTQFIVRSAGSSDEYMAFVLVGAATLIGFQFIINVGMNVGLAPVTGLPLPFVSYGSTHVVVELFLLGLLLIPRSRSRRS